MGREDARPSPSPWKRCQFLPLLRQLQLMRGPRRPNYFRPRLPAAAQSLRDTTKAALFRPPGSTVAFDENGRDLRR